VTIYPVLFGYRDLIAGNGFVAFVKADGRALLSEEDGGCWFYGVNPGGMAGGGKNREDAAREFKKSYLSVLFDIAAEARTFADFKAEVDAFFGEINRPTEREWSLAHQAVRRGDLTDLTLPRVKIEDRPTSISVAMVHEATAEPTTNQFDELSAAA